MEKVLPMAFGMVAGFCISFPVQIAFDLQNWQYFIFCTGVTFMCIVMLDTNMKTRR